MKIDDLINIAKQVETQTSKATDSVNDVHRFLRVFKVKDGSHRVRRYVVWQAFNMWIPGLLKEKEFYTQASKFLETHCFGPGKYYLINYKPLELLNKVDNLVR